MFESLSGGVLVAVPHLFGRRMTDELVKNKNQLSRWRWRCRLTSLSAVGYRDGGFQVVEDGSHLVTSEESVWENQFKECENVDEVIVIWPAAWLATVASCNARPIKETQPLIYGPPSSHFSLVSRGERSHVHFFMSCLELPVRPSGNHDAQRVASTQFYWIRLEVGRFYGLEPTHLRAGLTGRLLRHWKISHQFHVSTVAMLRFEFHISVDYFLGKKISTILICLTTEPETSGAIFFFFFNLTARWRSAHFLLFPFSVEKWYDSTAEREENIHENRRAHAHVADWLATITWGVACWNQIKWSRSTAREVDDFPNQMENSDEKGGVCRSLDSTDK